MSVCLSPDGRPDGGGKSQEGNTPGIPPIFREFVDLDFVSVWSALCVLTEDVYVLCALDCTVGVFLVEFGLLVFTVFILSVLSRISKASRCQAACLIFTGYFVYFIMFLLSRYLMNCFF